MNKSIEISPGPRLRLRLDDLIELVHGYHTTHLSVLLRDSGIDFGPAPADRNISVDFHRRGEEPA